MTGWLRANRAMLGMLVIFIVMVGVFVTWS